MSVVTADQFVSSISGSDTVETKLDELKAAIDKARRVVGRNVRKLDSMPYSSAKRALRAETEALRTRNSEMWNAMALCQNKPIEGKPNHYGIRPEAECEAMAVELLAKYRDLGWV